DGRPEPDPTLTALQAYLQCKAPWSVVVPYVQALRALVSHTPALGPRTNREFSRLLSTIKAATVLRHRNRKRDARGRLRATISDYRLAYVLLNPFWEATATGASKAIRQVVAAVKRMLRSSP